MSRLYVLTHEIIELEDYEEVPVEGTQIEIVGDTKTRAAQLEEGLRDIVSMYGGFTNTKEMMERARKALGALGSLDVPQPSDSDLLIAHLIDSQFSGGAAGG